MKRIRESRAYTAEQIPPKSNCEIAFIGRSNVGKSSLMNAILGYKVAQVSQKPGCTMWIGMHDFHGKTLIDLPGYGFAKANKNRRTVVSELVHSYFNMQRTDLIFILIDMRRGIMDIDKDVIEVLAGYSIPFYLIGTKSDKKGANVVDELDFTCSTKKNIGVIELRNLVMQYGYE